jgi:GNAT superfamily N-acetyltransferase
MTTISVPIRDAQVSDARDIAALTVQLGYEVAASSVAERLARMLARNDQRFLVAELDGDLIGWIHVSIWEFVETGAFAVVGGLVVDRRYRKKGIGRLLMTKAEEWAMEHGCSVMRLWTSAFRTESHRFYEHLGYANIKTQYSFVKAIAPAGQGAIHGFVPRVDS